MNCPNCGAQMRPGPVRGKQRCDYCDTIVEERPRDQASGPFALLLDRDGDGTPDFFQASTAMTQTRVSTSYEINGKRYESLEQVPEEFRNLFSAVGPMVETEAHVVEAGPKAESTAEHRRAEFTRSHASWSPRDLERVEFGARPSGSAWLKPFVFGVVAALLLGWLLFG